MCAAVRPFKNLFWLRPIATCMSCRQIVDSVIQNTVNKQHKFRCKECQSMRKNIQNQCDGICLFVCFWCCVSGAHWAREENWALQILRRWTHQYLESSEFQGNRKFKKPSCSGAIAPYNLLPLPLISPLVRDGRVRTHILYLLAIATAAMAAACVASIIPISVRTSYIAKMFRPNTKHKMRQKRRRPAKESVPVGMANLYSKLHSNKTYSRTGHTVSKKNENWYSKCYRWDALMHINTVEGIEKPEKRLPFSSKYLNSYLGFPFWSNIACVCVCVSCWLDLELFHGARKH